MNEYTTYSKSLLRKLFICLLAVFISISAIYLLLPTLQVYASESSGGKVNGGQADTSSSTSSQGRVGGPSETKTGIFLYFATKSNGTPETAGLLITKDGSPANIDATGLVSKSKFGKLADSFYYVDSNMPYPVLTQRLPDFESNGDKVRAYLERPVKVNGKEMPYYLYLANNKSFGNQMAFYTDEPMSVYDSLMRDPEDHVLVVMPVAWMNVYKNGECTSRVFMGTADGWGAMYNGLGKEKGDAQINRMTHKALPASMVLQEEKWGLKPHAGEELTYKLTYDEIKESGWDMFIIELPHSDDQTTCDEPEQPKPPQHLTKAQGQLQ